MFFKREVMFFELPGAGGNNIFWAPRTVYFNLYAFCGASDINNFWQCLHILYECVFDSFTGTDLALAPTSVLALSFSHCLYLFLTLSLISVLFFFFATTIFRMLHFVFYCYVDNYFSCLIFIDLSCVDYFLDKFLYLSISYFNRFLLDKKPAFFIYHFSHFFQFMIFHIFLCLPIFFFSFSLTFPDFHSTLPVYYDMTDKEKEKNTKSIFDWERLPMYKYVYIHMYRS